MSNQTDTEAMNELEQLLAEDTAPKKGKLSKKKKIIISAAAVVTAGAVAVSTVVIVKKKSSSSGDTVYRDYTVERGDILEGLTESSVITLDREAVEFPVNAEVLEIYVKAGSQVKKGDNLIRLSTDDIRESLADYEADLETAKAELTSARLNRETELLKAKQEWESSEQTGNNADSKLATSLEQAAFDLETKKEALESAQQSYDDTYAQSLTFTADKFALDSAESLMDARQSTVDACQEKMDAYNEVNDDLTAVNNKIRNIADASDMEQAEAVLSELKEQYDTMYSNYHADSSHNGVKLSELLKAEEKYKTLKNSMTTLEALFAKQEKLEAKLAKFDLDTIESNLSRAKKRLESAKESYEELSEDFREDYGNIESSDDMSAALKSAENALTRAELEYQSQQTAYDSAVLTANQNNETAVATASAAQTKYQLKKLELDNTVQKAQDSYDELQENLDDINDAITNNGIMTAPCNGVVANINVEEGDTVTVNSGSSGDSAMSGFSSSSTATLMSITDTSEVYVSISISEEEILEVTLGQEARVSMSAFPNQTFDAAVESISTEGSTLGAATVTYTVNVKFTVEEDLDLYDGMSADVTLIQDGVTDVLYVSKQAVATKNGQSVVYVKQQSGDPVETQVTTGYTDGQYIELKSGVKEGDSLVSPDSVNSTDASASQSEGKGEMPSFDGEMPSFDGEMPSFDGEMPDFGGGEMPDFGGGEMPDFGSGERPNMGNNQKSASE